MLAAPPAFLFSPRAQRIWLVVCLIWLAWLMVGIFPITPLEGDEQGVIQGVTALVRGQPRYWNLRYLYEIQPGSYVLIRWLVRLTGGSVDHCFATLSAGGALLFAGIGMLLVKCVLNSPWPLVVVGFFLSQEIWAGAYYMNTTALGGWLALLAVLLALKPLNLFRGLAVVALLAVAGWIRIDCLLISPAVAALVWRRRRTLRPTCREIIPVALGALALVVLLYFSSHVSLREFVLAYRNRNGIEGWGLTMRMYCIVTSALVGALSLVGLILLAVRRQGALLLFWLGGVGLSFAVYGRSLSSNKYLYLATPFFILAAVYAAQAIVIRWPAWPRSGRAVLMGAAVALLLFDTVLGVRTSTPEFRLFEPRPQWLTLATLPLRYRLVKLTLGSGELLATTDGYRLRGGALFAPLAWQSDKQEIVSRIDDLAVLLRRPGNDSVFVGDWLGYQLVLRVLRQEGFEFAAHIECGKPYACAGEWALGSKTVHLGYLAYTGSHYYDPRRVPLNVTGTRTWFVGALGESGPLVELADGLHWQLHSPDPYGYIKVHQRL